MENTPGPSAPVGAALDDTVDAVRALRRAEARVLHLVDELDRLGAATETGHGTTERLIAELVRVDRSEARALVRHGAVIGERPGLSGVPVEPVLPATARALDDGEIGRAHLEVVAVTMQRVARVPHLPSRVVAEVEGQLAELARHRTPRQLACDAAEILLRVDPDGELDDEPARPDQELHLSTGRDGSLRGRFRFADPEAAATVRTAIDALSACSSDFPPPDPDTDAGTLGRGPAERRADALRDMAADALGLADDAVQPSDALDLVPDDAVPADPASAGPSSGPDEPPSTTTARARSRPPRTQGGDAIGLIVTVPLDVLEERARDRACFGLLDGQWPVSAETARRLACDAAVVPAVLGSRGEVLDLGRKTRVVSTALRRALIVRDRHCAHPGCRRPPRSCRAHHIEPWSWGGPTDLGNLVLLCAYHHHLVHHSGWSIHMHDGIPVFTPPAWLDPLRRPLSRAAHNQMSQETTASSGVEMSYT